MKESKLKNPVTKTEIIVFEPLLNYYIHLLSLFSWYGPSFSC
uniref:Uncharacterized protein n=1 Tax=Rhizophora mucronata TaxID=61149 RepID=A0A2P2QSJ4_RHIMU